MTSALSTISDAEVNRVLEAAGEPSFRLEQVRRATWQPFIRSFNDMRQLPSGLRAALAECAAFSTVEVARTSKADGGRTLKLLCSLHDGLTVETVAMESPATRRSRRRATVCVSTQVGCAVGCPFCATGRMGLRRNCTAAEIVDQVRMAALALGDSGLGPITHVVYMGMGEPLANCDATLQSVRLLIERAGISPRRITVSTSGVVPAISRLAAEAPPVTLAVSLHAATDELRNRLVPLNRRYGLQALLDAAQSYAGDRGRRLTFEWCLIGGVNDSDEQARALRDLAWRAQAHVNVIPMNRIAGSPWGPPDRDVSASFVAQLRGVRTTVRDTRGEDVDGACGQLRAALEPRRRLLPDGRLAPPRHAPLS